MPCPAAPELPAAQTLEDAKSASRVDKSIEVVEVPCVDPPKPTCSPLMYTCTTEVVVTAVVVELTDVDDVVTVVGAVVTVAGGATEP